MDSLIPVLLAFQLSVGGSAGLEAPAPDRWFAEDKLKHFFMSFAATNLAYGAARTAGLERVPASIVAGLGAGAAGLGKELYDRSHGQPFSRKDLVWDGLGIGAGLVLATQTR